MCTCISIYKQIDLSSDGLSGSASREGRRTCRHKRYMYICICVRVLVYLSINR